MTPDTTRAAGTQPYFQRPVVFAAVCFLALGLLFTAYSNSFNNAFHFDDSHVIVDNLYIRNLNQIPRFFTDAMTFSSLPANAMYRPLLTTSFAIDYWLGRGLDPWQFHVTQFALLVLLGACSTYLLLRVMDAAAPAWWNRYLALCAATWFCLHTANTETVNYISSRSDLASTLGVVVAFCLYLAFPRARRFHLCLLPMVVGTLAKPPAVLFAPLWLAYLVLCEAPLAGRNPFSWPAWPQLRAAVRQTAPAFAVGIAVFLLVDSMNPPTLNYGNVDWFSYLLTQPFVWLHYLRLFFVPLGLTADTDWGLLPHWYDTRLLAGLLGIALLVWIGWRTAATQRTRPVAFGVFWFALALAPASSIIPLAEVANEHRIFFPYLGLTLAVVWGVRLWAARWVEMWPRVGTQTACVVALAVLSGHAAGTYQRNKVWKSAETLWGDVVEKSPNNARAWMNYGLSQMSQGRYERARELYERALVLSPNYSFLEVNLGIVTDRLGDPVSAEPHFLRALELAPDYAGGLYFYARWLVEQGRAGEAMPRLRRSSELSPAYSAPRGLLMNLHYVRQADAELDALVQATLAISPADPVARAYAAGGTPVTGADADAEARFKRGLGFTAQGQTLQAAIAYRHALEGNPDAVSRLNNYGWTIDTLGFHAAAIAPLERAVELAPDFQLAVNNLAAARANVARAQ